MLLASGAVRSDALRQAPAEHWGVGSGTVPLILPTAPTDPGSATVVLARDRAVLASWAACSLRPEPGSDDPLGPLAERSGRRLDGVPTTATFSYPAGHRPLQLWVDVAKGVRWDVEVLLTR